MFVSFAVHLPPDCTNRQVAIVFALIRPRSTVESSHLNFGFTLRPFVSRNRKIRPLPSFAGLSACISTEAGDSDTNDPERGSVPLETGVIHATGG